MIRNSLIRYLLFSAGFLILMMLQEVSSLPNNMSAVFWPVTGLLVAMLVASSRKDWIPYLVLSFFLFSFYSAVLHGGDGRLSLVFAAALCLGAAVGAAGYLYFVRGERRVFALRELALFTLFGAVVATFLDAFIEAAAVYFTYHMSSFWGPLMSLWFAKVIGAVAVGLPLMSWSDRAGWTELRGRLAELVVLCVSVVVVAWFSVGPAAGPATSLLDFPYLMIAVLLWTILRFDMRVVALSTSIIVLVSLLTASQGLGPFLVESQAPRLQVTSLQVFLFATIASSYFLSAVIEERRRHVEQLVASGGMHRALTENAADVTIVLSPDGKAKYISPSLSRILGYDPAQLSGDKVLTLIHERDHDYRDRILREARESAGTPLTFTNLRIKASSGGYRFLEGTVTDLSDEPGIEGTVVNCRDVTDRKKAEEQTVESEERFKVIAEAMPVPIFISKVDDGSFLYGNKHACDLIGCSSDQLLERSAVEFFAKPGRREDLLVDIAASGHVVDFEFTIRRDDGSTVDCSTSGQTIEYQGTQALLTALFDITDRKAAEAALRESEDRFRALVDGGFGGVVVVVDGKIVEANKGAARMMGFGTPGDVEGWPFSDFVTVESSRAISQKIDNDYRHPYEVIGVKKGGVEYPLELMGRTTTYQGKTASVTAMRDLSERMRFAEQQRSLEGKLRQSQKMESIGTLAGGIAHDFNNILVAIIGYAELLGEEVQESPVPKGYVEELLSASARASELVGHILQFSRQRDPELKVMRLDSVISEATRLLRASLPANVKLETDAGTEDVTIMGDPGQIHQIILNLGTNASHAIGEDSGELRIFLDTVNLDGETAELAGVSPDNYARLIFSDTGCGMDALTIDRIFDPFFTTKGVGEGTGLGLSAVHGIMLSHGGGIRVSSSPGMGSTFELYFPVVKGSVGATRNSGSRHIPTGTEKILFVDDEKQVVTLAKEMLSGFGYDVVTAPDGVKAEKLFLENPDSFDLVFTDQTMPNMSGLELIARVHQVVPEMPVVLATGFSESVTDDRLSEQRVDELIMKPYRRAQIANVIRRVLDKGINWGEQKRH